MGFRCSEPVFVDISLCALRLSHPILRIAFSIAY